MTNLTVAGEALERTDIDVSSIVDTWLLLRDIESDGERNRAMYVLKSRGMRHSNQLREFLLTDHGVELLDVYVGPEGVLTGSSRVSLEAKEKAARLASRQELERKRRDRLRKREALEAKIAVLRKEFEIEDDEVALLASQEEGQSRRMERDRETMARSRRADKDVPSSRSNKRRVP